MSTFMNGSHVNSELVHFSCGKVHLLSSFHVLSATTRVSITRKFLAILGRGTRAFQIWKISMVNHYIGKIVIVQY